ncbi:RHS repeat-associated core domain-containing protein, partial [Citrobacter sp. S2-9]
TPRELLTESGKVVWAQKLSVWGRSERYLFSRPGAENDDNVRGPDCPWRFAGQWADEESGLYYNRFRYYDVETGQYLSPDPMGLAGGLNPYGYVKNPLSYIDPLGLCPDSVATDRSFWSSDPIDFKGTKVYQRNDLFDPNRMTTWRERGKVISGTNIERMATGRAPIGFDDNPVNLHHMLQNPDGPIAEMSQTFHKSNSGIIHINPNTIPSGIDRATFDSWRKEYWTMRSRDFQ